MAKQQNTVSSETNVQAVRTQPSTLVLMKNRDTVPRSEDSTELPGATKLGIFWKDCKSRRRCVRPPYDRLLTNSVLRADYCSISSAREIHEET